MDAKEWIRRAIATTEIPSDGDADDTAGYLSRNDGTGIVVREATLSEASGLAAIGSRAFHHAHAAVLHPVELAGVASRFDEADIRRELSEPDSRWLAALWVGNIVGFAQLRTATVPADLPGRLPIELRGIFVAPDWSGHGVGSALIDASCKLAWSLGHESLWVRVFAANQSALSFLQRAGFTRTHHELVVGKMSRASVLTLSRVLAPMTSSSGSPR